MRQIEIDDEVYEYLRRKAELGEGANSVLRKEFKLGAVRSGPESEVEAFLRSSQFQALREPTGRFLAALGWLYAKKRESYGAVLRIKGRTRLYFAESAKALEDSGTSMQPHKVPGAPYWVVTNNDTAKKGVILGEAMRLLGYTAADARVLSEAIRG